MKSIYGFCYLLKTGTSNTKTGIYLLFIPASDNLERVLQLSMAASVDPTAPVTPALANEEATHGEDEATAMNNRYRRRLPW